MNTCKATLRVLFAHRVYLMIYLVFIGILMMSISWAMLTSASGSMSAVFESTKPRVAIIDRDSDRGDIATSMRAYLRDSSELVDLDDTSETLQQAVASNWVDLIVIIPDGFADDYVAAAADGDNPPNVDTVTSYASGSGSMARMNVGGFLSLTRTALIGAQTRVDQAALAGMMNATGGAAGFDGASLDQDMLDSLPEGQVDKPDIKDLSQAAKMAAESASDTDVNHQIAVVDTPTEESASAADTVPAVPGDDHLRIDDPGRVHHRRGAAASHRLAPTHGPDGTPAVADVGRIRARRMRRLFGAVNRSDDGGGARSVAPERRGSADDVRRDLRVRADDRRLRIHAQRVRALGRGGQRVRQHLRPAHHVHVGRRIAG